MTAIPVFRIETGISMDVLIFAVCALGNIALIERAARISLAG
jgi:hypothetical protein